MDEGLQGQCTGDLLLAWLSVLRVSAWQLDSHNDGTGIGGSLKDLGSVGEHLGPGLASSLPDP